MGKKAFHFCKYYFYEKNRNGLQELQSIEVRTLLYKQAKLQCSFTTGFYNSDKAFTSQSYLETNKISTKPVFQKLSIYCMKTFEKSIIALVSKTCLLPVCTHADILKKQKSELASQIAKSQSCAELWEHRGSVGSQKLEFIAAGLRSSSAHSRRCRKELRISF